VRSYKSNYSSLETVDEFIARGGYIKKHVTKYDFIGKKEKFIPDNDQIKQFYQSIQWGDLKKGFYQKCYREDLFYCQQCGCTNQKMMRVDHIRSVRYNWEFRLDSNNLQILCFRCNKEKNSSEYRATGIKKCQINCNKCSININKSYSLDEDKFCSDYAITQWLANRNQKEIDNHINLQVEIGEKNLAKYLAENQIK